MAKGALSWVTVGAEGTPAWFMQQIANLNQAINAQTAQINLQMNQLDELNARNMALQTRVHELETPTTFESASWIV